MLEHFSQHHLIEGKPQLKFNHIEAISNAIDSLPKDKKEILSWWSDHFKNLLTERQVA